MSDFPAANFAMDFRVRLNPVEIPVVVERLERLAHELGIELEPLDGDALPYEHTIPGLEEIVGALDRM